MPTSRYRFIQLYYATAMVPVLCGGLLSRYPSESIPWLIAEYAADVLWALFVYLLFRLIQPKRPPVYAAAGAWLVSLGVEVSQLYHPPWLDTIRANRIGALALGHGFLWTDLACYSVGTVIGLATDSWFLKQSKF